ncbi:MAG: ATP-dependent Clp protease adaptor ClpS [Phycisphaerales bacterium]
MPAAETHVQTETRDTTQTKRPKRWHVVLLDDDDHTYEYVIRMMQRVFGHDLSNAFTVARTVDKHGRAICMTTHRELAELKLEQITGFGPDQAIAACKGPMSAILQPADDDD